MVAPEEIFDLCLAQVSQRWNKAGFSLVFSTGETILREGAVMPTYWRSSLLGVLLPLLIVLSACGASSGGDTTNPGTSTNGPVRISTDHTTYQPDEAIHVTVSNQLSTSIFAYDTRASCSILGLEVQTNGRWSGSSIARCPLGRMARWVEIPAGKTYSTTIQAGGLSSGSFPPGTYRLSLSYSTSPKPGGLSGLTTIYSAPLTVAAS